MKQAIIIGVIHVRLDRLDSLVHNDVLIFFAIRCLSPSA